MGGMTSPSPSPRHINARRTGTSAGPLILSKLADGWQLLDGSLAAFAELGRGGYVRQAWLDQLPVRITYDGARGRTERTVRIDQLVMERTETLLNCLDLDKQARRQFKLHLIAAAELAR